MYEDLLYLFYEYMIKMLLLPFIIADRNMNTYTDFPKIILFQTSNKHLTLIRPGGEEIRNIVFDGLSFQVE